MTNAEPRVTGTCPNCTRRFAVNNDGTLRAHGPGCPGSAGPTAEHLYLAGGEAAIYAARSVTR